MSSPATSIGRRALLVGAGGAAGAFLGGRLTAGPEPRSYADALRALAATLTPFQRQTLVLPADDPTRQIANTVAVLDRPHLGTLLSAGQRRLVERLYEHMLSERGRQAFAGTVAVEGRFDGCVLALYGEPERGTAQAVFSGGHLLVRGGGESREGAALGGAVAYGHQEGNGQWRVRGNSFAYHGDAANRLYAALSATERGRAVVPEPPHELLLQVQDRGGRFVGLQVGGASDAAREAAAALLDTVLAIYPEAERRRAWACVRGNGGVEALHIAYYARRGFYPDMKDWASLDAAERARRGDPYWQVWRLEGPGTILHFKGHPHVHAYLQIVRDPRAANVGEALARTDATVEGPAMRAFVEAALRRATGERLAFAADSLPGRFCSGEVTTGLLHTLDPFREEVVVATIDERAMAAPLRQRLAGASVVAPGGRYRIATTAYQASDRRAFGRTEAVDGPRVALRSALIAHVRAGGLRSAGGSPA